MTKYLISLILLLLSGCSILPNFSIDKVEYCKKIRGVIYCDNGAEINMNRETYECSIYDDPRDCE